MHMKVDTRLKNDVECESRLTYKVQVLFRARLEKAEAWESLLTIHPGFEKGTFNTSWLALVKSGGRTPILNAI